MSSESVDAGCRTATHYISGDKIFDLLHVCPEISTSLRVYKIVGIDVTYSHRGNTLTSANVLVHSADWDTPSKSFEFRFNLNLDPNDSRYEVSFVGIDSDSDDNTTRELSDRFIPDLINIFRYFEIGFIPVRNAEDRQYIADYLKGLRNSKNMGVNLVYALIIGGSPIECFDYSGGDLSIKVYDIEGEFVYYIDLIRGMSGYGDIVRIFCLDAHCTPNWIETIDYEA